MVRHGEADTRQQQAKSCFVGTGVLDGRSPKNRVADATLFFCIKATKKIFFENFQKDLNSNVKITSNADRLISVHIFTVFDGFINTERGCHKRKYLLGKDFCSHRSVVVDRIGVRCFGK